MSVPQPGPVTSTAVRRRRVAALALVALCAAALGLGAFVGASGAGASPGAHAQVAASPRPSRMPTPTMATTAPPAFRPTPAVTGTPAPVVLPFDRAARSIDDPASIWVIVNKKRPLVPANFAASDLVTVPVPHVWEPRLRQEASTATVALFAAAQAEAGLQMQSQSAYRSYDSQVSVYNEEMAAHGQAAADADTARPGFSEHQTGLAIDISAVPAACSLAQCFGQTPHGQWLAANAWRFGFLLRYPADKTPVTGYTYEPWHFRYIGVDLATEMRTTGVTTLEEFFGLPPAPTY